MSASGDKAYPQSPFTEVRTAQQIQELYGAASIFASGLIVDGLHAFYGDLWQACVTAMTFSSATGYVEQSSSHRTTSPAVLTV